jgi:hypothetical protein
MKAPAITVHDFSQARVAVAAADRLGVPVRLVSPPAGAGYLGVAWMAALLSELREAYPDAAVGSVLDCGDDAGLAMAAAQERAADTLVFCGHAETVRRLAAIARAAGMTLTDARPPSLDLLGAADPEAACRDWLERGGGVTLPGN